MTEAATVIPDRMMYEAYYSYEVNDGMTITPLIYTVEGKVRLMKMKLESWLKHHSASKSKLEILHTSKDLLYAGLFYFV